MLYRVNFLYDGRYLPLFAEAETEAEAYDKAYSKLDNAKEITHLGTNKVELPYIKYLDYIPWYTKSGEKRFCYKCYAESEKSMAKSHEIDENKDYAADGYYLEFEVSFDSSKRLIEFHLLMQDQFTNEEDGSPEYSEPQLIGSEVYLHDPNGKIAGHSLLTDEEFSYILYLAKKKLDEVYDEFDFDDKEDKAC